MGEIIELGLAVSIAGQVAVGLAEGDDQEQRAMGALLAIGLMVKNSAHSEMVDKILDTADTTSIVASDPGSWIITRKGSDGEA